MKLWTIQPESVYEIIVNEGVYRCDISKSEFDFCISEYDWLVGQMKKILNSDTDEIRYPVWAWYTKEGKRKKPDLRKARFRSGFKGDKFVCMEVDIPDEKVVLSDFNAWCIIMNDSLISDTEEEDVRLQQMYESLDEEGKQAFKHKNWERVFNLSPIENDWNCRGKYIQATFWELRAEQVKKVWKFESANRIVNTKSKDTKCES